MQEFSWQEYDSTSSQYDLMTRERNGAVKEQLARNPGVANRFSQADSLH